MGGELWPLTFIGRQIDAHHKKRNLYFYRRIFEIFICMIDYENFVCLYPNDNSMDIVDT